VAIYTFLILFDQILTQTLAWLGCQFVYSRSCLIVNHVLTWTTLVWILMSYLIGKKILVTCAQNVSVKYFYFKKRIDNVK